MHLLVEELYLSRREFERNLEGLTDDNARKRIEPMNYISWIIAHVANQHRTFFVDWPASRETNPLYKPYGFGAPPSQPPLEKALTLYRNACKDSDAWLQSATSESLQKTFACNSLANENAGTLLVRCIFHTWCHIGEISSIRQILGHKPPQFVNMHDWLYDGT